MGQGQSDTSSGICHCQQCYDDVFIDENATLKLSNHGVPFIPECEVFYEGGPNAAELVTNCSKNPGHPNFIPVNEFSMDHLPPGYQTDHVMKYIRRHINTTVKITVRYTSFSRPATYHNSSFPYPYSSIKGSNRAVRCGTGVFILGPVKKTGHCPCHSCKASGKPKRKYLLGVVSTAAHVIFDDEEAKRSTFDLYYDSEDNEDKVKRLDGVGLFKDNLYNHKINDNAGDADNIEQETSREVEDPVKMDEEEAEVIMKRCHQDRMWVLCATHDLDLLQTMKDDKEELPHSSGKKAFLPRKYGVIVSHPHGLSKRISFGNILKHRYPLSPYKTIDVPYSFGPGVMCRIPKHCQCSKSSMNTSVSSEIEFNNKEKQLLLQFQQFLKLGFECRNGVEYTLKHPLSILPPLDANYLSESVFQKGCVDYWVRFHPGTKFALQEGDGDHAALSYLDLQGVEFNFFAADFNFYTGLSYATYDIDTCPGSSGAKVLFTEIKEFQGQHSGALGNRINRSALDFY